MRPSFRRLIGYLWVLAVLLGFLKISRPDVLMAYFENLISQIFFSFQLKCYQVILVLVPTFVELKKNLFTGLPSALVVELSKST